MVLTPNLFSKTTLLVWQEVSYMHGGTIDHCKLTHGLDSYSSGEVFNMIVHNSDSDYNTTSSISSDPFYICSCKNNYPHDRDLVW